MNSLIKKIDKTFLLFIILLFVLDGIIWHFILFERGGENKTELYFFDIGQGDSQLLSLPEEMHSKNRITILVDGGKPNKRILEELSTVIPSEDPYIDIVIMTHPDNDHFGGLIDVLKKYNVGVFLGTGRKGSSESYNELHATLKEKSVSYIEVAEGDSIRHGDTLISFLGPDTSSVLSDAANDTSLIFLLETGGLRALYTGDIDQYSEQRLIARYGLSVHVLKVAHHGSKFASSKAFLSETRPKFAIISVGKNRYGHPTKEVLDRLEASGAQIFRTDQNGTIRIVSDGEIISVFKEK